MTGGPLPLLAMVVLIGLSVVMIGLAVWVSHQVLRPTEALENSRGELQRMYEAAKADSMRDGLTGLGNFRAFQEELDRQIEWYQRYKVPLALLIVDVDDLNVLNESEGHAAGDEVLREMGHLIGQVARYADRSFRIGGDKFAVLMPHTDAEGALQMGRRLLATAGHPKAKRPSGHVLGRRVRLSRRWPRRVRSCSAQASAALAWCKRHGRGTIDEFDPVRDRDADQQANGELSASILRVANKAACCSAVYQPIVDLASGTVVIGFEGLIRPAPETGFADPDLAGFIGRQCRSQRRARSRVHRHHRAARRAALASHATAERQRLTALPRGAALLGRVDRQRAASRRASSRRASSSS